jgi:hypothetical protein
VCGQRSPDRKARVDLQEPELLVAGILRELDVRDPGVAGRLQEPQPELGPWRTLRPTSVTSGVPSRPM